MVEEEWWSLLKDGIGCKLIVLCIVVFQLIFTTETINLAKSKVPPKILNFSNDSLEFAVRLLSFISVLQGAHHSRLTPYSCWFLSTQGTCEHIKDMYLSISVSLHYNAMPAFNTAVLADWEGWETKGCPPEPPGIFRTIFLSEQNTGHHSWQWILLLLYFIWLSSLSSPNI